MPDWVLSNVLLLGTLMGPVVLHVLCRVAGTSRRRTDLASATLWGTANGLLFSVAVRAEPEYRLTSIVIALGVLFVSGMILGASMMVSKFRETGEL